METPESGAASAATTEHPPAAAADPELAAPSNEGAESATAPAGDPELAAGAESDESFQARMAANIAAREKLRADTPAQVVSIKPQHKQQLLGMVVQDFFTGAVLRTARLEDWRTEQVSLQAGQHAHIVVLAGNDLEHFEAIERHLANAKASPAQAEG